MRQFAIAASMGLMAILLGCQSSDSQLNDGGLDDEGTRGPRYTIKIELAQDSKLLTRVKELAGRMKQPRSTQLLAVSKILEYDGFEKLTFTVDLMQKNDTRIADALVELEKAEDLELSREQRMILTWDKNDDEYKMSHKLKYLRKNTERIRARLTTLEKKYPAPPKDK